MLAATLSSADQQNFEKLKDAYDACMDEDTIKKEGIKPLTEILKEIMDMFNKKEDLADTIIYVANLGVSAFISTGAGADDKDPDTVVAQASPPYRIGLPAKDYYSDEIVVYVHARNSGLEHGYTFDETHLTFHLDRNTKIRSHRFSTTFIQATKVKVMLPRWWI